MSIKIFFCFCLLYFLNESYVEGHCNQMNTSDSGNPNFEVRGIFQPCVRELSGKDKGGVEDKGEAGHDLAMKCRRKIVVSLKITSREPAECHDHLILLDHVYDPLLNESSRLLNPVVIRVKQERIVKLYDLNFIKLVNAEPKEVIKKLPSHSKKCKKPVECGTTSKRLRKLHGSFQGICCSCDLKKLRHQSKCNQKSHASCLHHQQGSLPYEHCVRKAHDSCINEDRSHNEIQNFPPPQMPGKYGNDILCHGKRICHANRHKLKDEELARKWRSGDYDDEESDSELDGTQVVSNENDESSVTGEKYLAGDAMGDVKMTLNNAGNIDEDGMNIDESNSMSVNALESEGENSPNVNEEDMNGKHIREAVEDADFNSSQDSRLDGEEEVLSGEDDDEMMDEELQENLGRGMSLYDSTTVMDRKQKRLVDYPQENADDDTGFYNSREQWLHSGRAGMSGEGCPQGPSNIAIHCLKFSDVWYEVYQLTNLSYKHVLSLQVFEKQSDKDGSKVWAETTKGEPVRLSSIIINMNDSLNSYKVLDINDEETLLNPEIHRLLIPHMVEDSGKKTHARAIDKPGKFLVLTEDSISANGSECDKVGVTAEGFIRQQDRCTSKRGFCLKNQPSVLWRRDNEKAKHGRKGQFFLKNYGSLSKNPYIVDEMSGKKSISQDFNGTHMSLADVAVPAVGNQVVRKGIPAQITTVIVDATSPHHTILTVSVTNLGLASGQFFVQLGKCHPSWSNGSSAYSHGHRMVVIPPLHQYEFTLDLSKKPIREKISCIVEVWNDKKHLLAVRRVTIENSGRCICLWHCQCDCMKNMVNIRCKLMTVSEVQAAGLKGAIPVLLPLKPYQYLIVFEDDDSSRCVLFFLFGVLLLFLLLGVAKALLGVTFWASIWSWGLPYYRGPKNMAQYRESELKHREVKFDEEGYPVHPDTKKRTVQLYSRWVELLLNIFIFLFLPLLGLFWWPICWCCSLCHRNVIGYRWIFSTTKKSCSNYSNSSTVGSMPSSDVEEAIKIPEEETSTSKCSSNTGSEGGSGKSSLSSKQKTNYEESNGNKDAIDVGNIDALRSDKNHEAPSSHSITRRKNDKNGSHQSPEHGSLQVGLQTPMDVVNLPSYESQVSIEAYDGTADEQEASDVDYVLKQLRRSSTAIQKSHERISSAGGPLTNKVLSISGRGEVIEDPELSPRMETSSDDSIQGRLLDMKMAAEEKEKNFFMPYAPGNDLKPVPPPSSQVEPQSSGMPNGFASQGLSDHVSASAAGMEYTFQNTQANAVEREASEKSGSALEELTGLSEVTTKDSLENDEEGDGNISKEAAEILVEKLHAQRVVFLKVDHPIGNVIFPSNQPYSIRGYFLKTNGGYKFIPPSPLKQHWTLDADGSNLEQLDSPRSLKMEPFERDYPNTQSVAEAGDLSEYPLSTCINVKTQSFDSPLSASSHSK